MRLLIVLLCACTASAAVVEGLVLDEESGNPLARTLIELIPLPGTPANTVSIRAGDRGTFSILNVRPGWYVLRTSRRGFIGAEAGQLRPGRPGMPFEIADDRQSHFLQIRMRRLGAVTGSVLDENGVGIPEWPINIYTARKPVQRIAQVKTDDRGMYRIGELEAGTYLMRTSEGLLEDGTMLLPTYYKFGTAVETAEPARVRLGETQPDLVVRPVKGKLIELSGSVNGPGNAPVRLTMITDTGRREVAAIYPPNTTAPFQVSNVPPGLVDFVAEGPGCGGYIRVIAERDAQGIRIACGPLRQPYVSWQVNDGTGGHLQFALEVRRIDLDGTGPVRTVKSRDTLIPGHWEARAVTSADYYVTNIRVRSGGETASRGDGWFAIDIGTYSDLWVSLSSHPASISGVVSSGGKAVSGAPVFLELYNPLGTDPRISLTPGRADHDGKYRFTGLAPGNYRVISSFDLDPEDPYVMQKAANLTLHQGDVASQALEMILP